MNEFSIPEAGARREFLLHGASAFHEFCGFEARAGHEFLIPTARNAPGILIFAAGIAPGISCMNFVTAQHGFWGPESIAKMTQVRNDKIHVHLKSCRLAFSVATCVQLCYSIVCICVWQRV